MKLYAAIDLHSNNNVLEILNEQDQIVYERRHRNELTSVLMALSPYRESIEAVAVESTFNWYWLVDGLMDAGYAVKLVNTTAVKQYEGLKYSGDEEDARHLAHLLRLGVLPTGYIYPKADRAMRDLLRKRGQLVRTRTAQLLSIQNQASRNTGKSIKAGEIRKLDQEGLNRLSVGDPTRELAIRSNLAVLGCLDEQIKLLEQRLLSAAKLDAAFEILLTVCGIGKILGMTIMYETGDIGRFAEVGNFASYARCVDSGRWSNGKKKGEGNRKNGNRFLSWAFVEAAHHAIRHSDRIRRFYDRKKAKKNAAVAVKAVAHKLARACFHMLKNQQPFDEARAFA
jgi:transposase